MAWGEKNLAQRKEGGKPGDKYSGELAIRLIQCDINERPPNLNLESQGNGL